MREIKLKHELLNGGYTCVAFDENGMYYSSKARGILPLVELCEKNASGKKLCLADKITGKAAALLSVKCGAHKLYTRVITQDALFVLDKHNIKVEYEKIVPFIKNRSGDGRCPMEQLARNVSYPKQMYDKVKTFLENSGTPPGND